MDNEERDKLYADFMIYNGGCTIWYIRDNIMEFTDKLDKVLETLAQDPRHEIEL